MVGAIALAPPAIVEAGSQMLNPTVLILGLAVGLLSSVIPYSFELIALRRIPPRVFSILMSLEPAVAALAAMILLGEFLSLVQWLAMACVVMASIGATRTSTTLDQPAPD
jgi:inner membrane transporter RhtA